MTKNFNTTYEPFKGQGILTRLSDGRVIRATRETPGEPTRDMGSLYPYMPKTTQFLFDLPKVQMNPFARLTSVYGAEYGSYIELGALGDPNYEGAGGETVGVNIPNRGFTEACMVYDRPKYTANYLFQNLYTHSAYIDQPHGRKGVVRTAEEASKLSTAVTMSMAQELSIKRKATMTRLFCDCVDGFSGVMTDGTFKSGMNADNASPITAPNEEIKGWAGKEISYSNLVLPELDVGVNNGQADIIDTEDAMKLAKDIRSSLTYGQFLGNYFVPGHVRLDAFTSPVLVMEAAVKQALDDSFLNANISTGGSDNPLSFNMTWSDYVVKDTPVEILTTDIFEPLPKVDDEGTDSSKRLLCALVEPDMFKNFVYTDDLMSQPCIQPRGMVYDYQRTEILGVDVRRPSVVFTASL